MWTTPLDTDKSSMAFSSKLIQKAQESGGPTAISSTCTYMHVCVCTWRSLSFSHTHVYTMLLNHCVALGNSCPLPGQFHHWSHGRSLLIFKDPSNSNILGAWMAVPMPVHQSPPTPSFQALWLLESTLPLPTCVHGDLRDCSPSRYMIKSGSVGKGNPVPAFLL